MVRRCGGCTLCCKLLPVRELDKPANTRCRHQSTGRGCRVYASAAMPHSCSLWSCRWLIDEKTADLSRPDRAGYVIDVMLDYIEAQDGVTGVTSKVPVLQVWIDPARPEAWKDDKPFFAYVERMAMEHGTATLLRFDSARARLIAAPCLSDDGEWHIIDTMSQVAQHTPEELANAGLGMQIEVV